MRPVRHVITAVLQAGIRAESYIQAHTLQAGLSSGGRARRSCVHSYIITILSVFAMNTLLHIICPVSICWIAVLYLSIHPSIYRSIYRCIVLSICRSIYLSIYRSIILFIVLLFYPSVYLSFYHSIYNSFYRSFYLLFNFSISVVL